MKISANEIKVGNILEFENKLWKVLKYEHRKPGKGGAYIQVELKDINLGNKKNERFRSDENVEKAYLEQKNFQFLYSSGDEYFFMDQKNYEQISINKEKIINNILPYLKDGINLSLELKDDKPINILLPENSLLQYVHFLLSLEKEIFPYLSCKCIFDIFTFLLSFIFKIVSNFLLFIKFSNVFILNLISKFTLVSEQFDL